MYKKLFLLVLTFLIPTFSFAQATQEKQEDVFSIAVSVNQAIIDHNARNVDIFYQVESRDREYSDLRVGVEFLNINDLFAPALYSYFPNQSVTLSPRVPKENVLNLVVPESLTGKVTPRLVVYGQNDFLVAYRDMGIITLAPSTYKKVSIESCEAENKKATCVLSRKLQSGEVATLNLKQGGRSGSIAEVQKTTNTQSATLVFNFTQELSVIPNPLLEAFVSTGDTKLTEAYFPVTGKIIYQSVINIFSGEKVEGDVRFSVLATKNYASENETLKVALYDPSNKVCDSQEKPFTESIQTFSFAGKVKCNAVRALATISQAGRVVSARQVYTSNLFTFEEEKLAETPITNNFINTKNMTLLALILVALGLLVLMRGKKSAVVAVFVVLAVFVGGVERVEATMTVTPPSSWAEREIRFPKERVTVRYRCSIPVNASVNAGGIGSWGAGGTCSVISFSPASAATNYKISMSVKPEEIEDNHSISSYGYVTCSGGVDDIPGYYIACSGGGQFTPLDPSQYPSQQTICGAPGSGSGSAKLYSQTTGLLVETIAVNGTAEKPCWGIPYSFSQPTGVCRNGIIESMEQCDDGLANTSNTDSCTNLCRDARCGDGYLRTDITNTSSAAYEQCDAGSLNGTPSSGCDLNCRICSGEECSPQRYACAGGCQECGKPGQPTCPSGAYTTLSACTYACAITSEISCGYIANPTSATVGQTVGLTLTTQRPIGGQQGTIGGSGGYHNVEFIGCEYNRTPNLVGEFNTSGTTDPGYWEGLSNPLVLGVNAFNARCTFRYDSWNPEPEPGTLEEGQQTIQCLASTVTGSAVGTQGFRCGSCSTAGAACASGEQNCYADTASCTATCPTVPNPINIGWSGAPNYTPKDITINLGQGQTNTSQTLYVTTGGRKGCYIAGSFSPTNNTGINTPPGDPDFPMGSSYLVSDRPAGSYRYTLNCAGQSPVFADLTVNPYSGSVTRYQCSPAGSTGPCTQTTCVANDAGCISSTYGDATTCEAETSCNTVDVCSTGLCSTDCPQNCNTDAAECVGGQATIIEPANQRVLSGQPFRVRFSFRNIGNTTWSNPKYQVTTTGTTYPQWRTAFGIPVGTSLTRDIFPDSITGSLGGYGQTSEYTPTFTAPVVTSQMSYPLGFTITKNGSPFNSQCLANGDGNVVVSLPECSDGVDNSDPEDTSAPLIDCADPGCWPRGVVGASGDKCDTGDDDETDNIGSDMSITANPQLVRSGGSSNVTFTCGAGTWQLTGPQINGFTNITGITRDTSSDGCDNGSVFCGTKAVTDGVFPAQSITFKETYVLRCGGKERSATISVIKINEV